MAFHVDIDEAVGAVFPDVCPFTGKARARGRVKLEQRGNRFVLPTPWFIYFRGSRRTAWIPAHRFFAWTVAGLDALQLLVIIAGFWGVGYVLINDQSNGPINPLFALWPLIAGFGLSWIVKFWPSRITRNVQLTNFDSELCFLNEAYAHQFAEMNQTSVREFI